MNAQASLNFDLAEPDVKSLVDMVRTLLTNGEWWAPWEICEEIWKTRGVRVSDSSCTARLRDIRKAQYGAHTVAIRKRHGTKYYEYRLEK